MCGIFGVFRADGELPDAERLEGTARLLGHRGPDDRGTYREPGLGLAHTRLSLLDLDRRSSQPFHDPTGRWTLVYKGEVYNFATLRHRLEGLGVRLRTTSDTEVVLHALVTFGIDEAVAAFEGMFALALWDREQRRLTLARDRFGIKPLFVRPGRELLFASEIQSFAPWMTLRPDHRCINAFLYGSSGPTDGRTFFEGIEFLSPGTVMTVEPGGPVVERQVLPVADLWDETRREELARLPDDRLLDTIEAQLEAAVQSQLVADVPVGALCSGGLDSSLLMALAARNHRDLAIFHADVVGPTSERAAATDLAEHLGLELRVATVTDDDFIELLPELTRHHGNPFLANPHAVPFYKVSELVRATGVKAVLSGEGADEAFLGYPWLVPGRTRRAEPRWSADPGRIDPARNGGAGRGEVLTAAFGGFEVEADAERIRREAPEATGAIRSVDLLGRNLRGLLHRNDAMGMAAAVESRFPFLDGALATTAVNLPDRCKIRFGLNLGDRRHPFHVAKWALRKVAERHLPRGISRRAKYPFATTVYGRLQVDPELFRDSFVAETFGLANRDLERLVAAADAKLVAKLVHLEVWGRVFLAEEPCESVVKRLKDDVVLRAIG